MPEKIITKIQTFLSWFALVVPLLAVAIVIGSYFVSASQPYRGPTLFYFYVALSTALISRKWSTYLLILALPLLPGLPTQAEYIFHPAVKYFVAYPGIDMIAGLFIGQCARSFYLKQSLNSWLKPPPWPFGLALLIITLSTGITISRNLWQSASWFSLSGVVNNIFRFKHMGRGNDFLPFTDLLVYSFAVLLIICVLQTIKDSDNKDDVVFKPVIVGLIISACWGIFQAFTAFGLPNSAAEYRANTLGFSAFGFQPDIHAFAGHMLLGAVGLTGYFLISRPSQIWKYIVFIACAMSWLAVFLSKSRASLVFAVIFVAMVSLIIAKQKKINLVNRYVILTILTVGVLIGWLSLNEKFWIMDAIREIQAADLTSFDTLSRLSVYRLEIFLSALRMFSHYPLMGVGQGNFFHLSSLLDFAGSPWVTQTGGENAHNYFLQTLAELGVVGIGGFLIVFLWPVRQAKQLKTIVPAIIAILSIFLGNLYSHSLIIRENLFLLAVFVAVLYAWVKPYLQENVKLIGGEKNFYSSKTSKYFLFGIAILTIFFSWKEVVTSPGKPPFEYGSECYRGSSSLDPGWTDGLFITVMPSASTGIKLFIDQNQPDSKSHPLSLSLSIIDSTGKVLVKSEILAESDDQFAIEALLPDNFKLAGEESRAVLRLSRCFTPSNFGIKDDSRKFGVHLKKIQIY